MGKRWRPIKGTVVGERGTDRILSQAGLPGNQTLTQRFACSRLTGQNAQSELLSDREGSRLGRGRRASCDIVTTKASVNLWGALELEGP